MNIEISVIICTLNRSKYLEKAIYSLQNQEYDLQKMEIIIVDGGSTDQTREIVYSYQKKIPNLIFFSQKAQGLSAARNTGVNIAKGDFVAFLDDDAIAETGWISSIVTTFKLILPAPQACGGKVELIWESSRPDWLDDSLLIFLGKFYHGNDGFFVKKPENFLGGLNMAFRKDVFIKIGYFDINLGRKKHNLLSNEEVELFQRMIDNDLPIYYNPQIIVHHHVTQERLKKEWFYKRYYWQGISTLIMDKKKLKQSFNDYLNFFLEITKNLLNLLLKPLYIILTKKEKNQFTYKCAFNYSKGYIAQVIKNLVYFN